MVDSSALRSSVFRLASVTPRDNDDRQRVMGTSKNALHGNFLHGKAKTRF